MISHAQNTEPGLFQHSAKPVRAPRPCGLAWSQGRIVPTDEGFRTRVAQIHASPTGSIRAGEVHVFVADRGNFGVAATASQTTPGQLADAEYSHSSTIAD